MIKTEKMTVTCQGRQLTVAIKQKINSDHLILFLHGLGCAKESFDYAFESDGLADYSLCALDFIGFGESDKPDDFSYTLEDQTDITRQIVEQLAPQHISIVAHSMGGAIGLLLAQHLSNLAKFINVEGNLVAGDCGLVTRNTAKLPLDEFEQSGYQEFLTLLTSSDRNDFHIWANWYRQATPKAIHVSCQSTVAWSDNGELLDIFNALQDKAYIYGDEEPKDYLLPRLQNMDIRYIPKLKHFMMVEDPDQFYGVLSDIFKEA